MLRFLRNWWAKRRKKRGLCRYDMIWHSCGLGPIALRPSERCPFCELSFERALSDHIEFLCESEVLERQQLLRERKRDGSPGRP